MTVKSSISLSDQQDAFARALVDEGRYQSVSAVVQQGLELLREKTLAEKAETEALIALVESRRSGRFVTGDEMADRVQAMTDRKRRDYGLGD